MVEYGSVFKGCYYAGSRSAGSVVECKKMTVDGVSVTVYYEGGRRNGKRKLFKILDSMKDQNYDSVEECISIAMGFANAVDAKFEEVRE